MDEVLTDLYSFKRDIDDFLEDSVEVAKHHKNPDVNFCSWFIIQPSQRYKHDIQELESLLPKLLDACDCFIANYNDHVRQETFQKIINSIEVCLLSNTFHNSSLRWVILLD